jgi:phosphoglycerol geranylgeranyltransferase
MSETGCVHLALLDPERPVGKLSDVVQELESIGTVAVMIGGSTVRSSAQLDKMVETVKTSCHLPTILFPNNESGISRHADAIFFMSLLNSSNPRYLIGAQAKGAPAVKAFGIEPIPLGYIVVGPSDTAVSTIGQVERVPYSRPEIAANYALAGQYLGMRFVYLEAGSGAKEPVDPEMIKRVSSTIDIPVIVGGGIRTASQAELIAKSGASAIVTGTVLEKEGTGPVERIISSIKRA